MLHPYLKDMPVLQRDELETILQKLNAGTADDEGDVHVQAADLLTFLIARAHHVDDCRVMLEGNTSEVLSDIIETGTEVEQNLVAELASKMLDETSKTSANPENVGDPPDISQGKRN